MHTARIALRLAMAALYYIAGGLHLGLTDSFVAIVPGWVPHPYAIVVFTGGCELLGATGLLIPRLRKFAGIMLALYAVCVFPANLHQALGHIPIFGVDPGWGYHAPRLALQPLLVWAALFGADVIDWPFHRRGKRFQSFN